MSTRDSVKEYRLLKLENPSLMIKRICDLRHTRPIEMTDKPENAWHIFSRMGSTKFHNKWNYKWCGHQHFPCIQEPCPEFNEGVCLCDAPFTTAIASIAFNRIRTNYGYYGLMAFIHSPWVAFAAYMRKEEHKSFLEASEEWPTEKCEWYTHGNDYSKEVYVPQSQKLLEEPSQTVSNSLDQLIEFVTSS